MTAWKAERRQLMMRLPICALALALGACSSFPTVQHPIIAPANACAPSEVRSFVEGAMYELGHPQSLPPRSIEAAR